MFLNNVYKSINQVHNNNTEYTNICVIMLLFQRKPFSENTNEQIQPASNFKGLIPYPLSFMHTHKLTPTCHKIIKGDKDSAGLNAKWLPSLILLRPASFLLTPREKKVKVQKGALMQTWNCLDFNIMLRPWHVPRCTCMRACVRACVRVRKTWFLCWVHMCVGGSVVYLCVSV